MKMITISTSLTPAVNVSVLLKGNTESPRRVLILFHGRGSSADDIIRIADSIALPDDVVVMAPEAPPHEWYPFRFIEPQTRNEPRLSSALATVQALLAYCETSWGIPAGQVVLAGFSQGACVIAEYAARNPQRYGGICIFSGGLIGEDGEVEKCTWNGDFKQTPVYIGCDRNDAHIPLERVLKTADVYEQLHAKVEARIYEGLGHTIHPEGLEFLSNLFTVWDEIGTILKI